MLRYRIIIKLREGSELFLSLGYYAGYYSYSTRPDRPLVLLVQALVGWGTEWERLVNKAYCYLSSKPDSSGGTTVFCKPTVHMNGFNHSIYKVMFLVY